MSSFSPYNPRYYYGIFLRIFDVCRLWKKLTCHSAVLYESVIFFPFFFFFLQFTYLLLVRNNYVL